MGGVGGWGCAVQDGGVGTVLMGAQGTPGDGAWIGGLALLWSQPRPAQVEPSPALTKQQIPSDCNILGDA